MSTARPKQRRKARKPTAPPRPTDRFREPVTRRLHLKVITDTAGLRHVELTQPVFGEDWQNRLLAAMAELSYMLLHRGRTLAGVVSLGATAMLDATRKVEELLALVPPGSVACRDACDHCCHQRVGVTPLEAITILAHLRCAQPRQQQEELRRRVRKAVQDAQGLSSEERISKNLPCPFLVNHRCSIYEVRPLACRGVHSLDAAICEENLLDRAQRRARDEGRLPGYFFVEPLRAIHAASAGLQLALYELFELDMRPLDLTLVMDALLAELDEDAPLESSSLARDWLLGRDVLHPMRGGDASERAGMRELVGALPRR